MKLHVDPEAPRDILDEDGELIATVYLAARTPSAAETIASAEALARQFAASGEVLAERDSLLAQVGNDAESIKGLIDAATTVSGLLRRSQRQTQRDAALIAELAAALAEIHDWILQSGQSAHLGKAKAALSAARAAESRAEAKPEPEVAK